MIYVFRWDLMVYTNAIQSVYAIDLELDLELDLKYTCITCLSFLQYMHVWVRILLFKIMSQVAVFKG